MTAIIWLLLALGSGAHPVPIALASILFAALIVGAALAGYPWRCSLPAAALVAFIAAILLPRAFVIDAVLLRDAAGLPPMRLHLAIGLSIGGVAMAFFAFLVVGFLAPLVAAIIAWRRQLPGAVTTLVIKSLLVAAAIGVAAAPLTPTFKDAWFALLRPSRDAIVRQIQMHPDAAGWYRAEQTFPRVACCGNIVRVFEHGDRILFPMADYGDGFWAYFYDRSTRDDRTFNFRTVRDYGGGWTLVEIRREESPS
jgi:hypothetical protein